jgi:membrane protease YdiL (CAAX protease family)
LAVETAIERLVRVRDRLRALPLPGFLCPIETSRHLGLAFLVLCGAALAIYVAIDLERGIGVPEPGEALAIHILLGVVSGVAEEALFRGLARRVLGNGGLVIGTICWVALHQFYAGVATIYRLPGDILVGTFYLKLWRGRLWWLALVIHPLWNAAVITGWQMVKMSAM